MRLNGKIALVTGGTSGIGRRCIERFIEEGATVVFTGRRTDLGEEVAAATGAAFLQADAGSVGDAERVVGEVLSRHGRLDVLMNNAGAPAKGGRIEDTSMDSFDTAMAVHVRGALAHIKFAAPAMKAQKSGSIINVGSVAAHQSGRSSSLIYGIAKAAVVHMTRLAAMELGEDNVRVNSISPGAIATGIMAKASGIDPAKAETTVEKIKDTLATLQAVPRAGTVDDIAHAAVYLASDESGFVCGEDIVIDGGMIWGRRYSEVAKGGGIWAGLFD